MLQNLHVKNLALIDESEVDFAGGLNILSGETGAGKTSIAKAILRILPDVSAKSGGEVYFQGTDMMKLKEKEMQKIRGHKISMIFQDPMTALNPTMRIGRQISEVVSAHRNISKEEAEIEGKRMLELVGIPAERYNEFPHQFSGGMKQRVVIAIALACNPELLLADEPTTALDVTIQAQILDLMNKLKKEIGTSILFITHDLGVVAEVCDQVVVMYCGRVVEKGSVYDIFDKPSHPYTEGLLNSIPKLGEYVEELESIPGNVPNPKYMPKGCKFAPRCKYAFDRCREEEPGFTDLGNGHQSRCWRCMQEGGKD